jgi:hypothetical protein
VSDADAMDPQDDLATYAGAEITGGATNVGPGSVQIDLDSLVIEPNPPSRPAYDTDGNGTNDSDFQEGGGVIVVDAWNSARGSACGFIESVDVGNERLNVVITSQDLAAAGALTNLVAIPAHEYRVDGAALRRDGLLLAEGVEDLQVAYFFDGDDDLQVDNGEYVGISGGNYAADVENAEELRELRVNLVVRTRSEDAEFDSGLPQELENRAYAGGPAPDGFRRRVHTSRIMVRNVGNRM